MRGQVLLASPIKEATYLLRGYYLRLGKLKMAQIQYCFYYNFMQLSAENISLILLLQEEEMQLVIKAVPQKCAKEIKHLLNEWTILSKLVHDNIVEVYRWGKEVSLPGREGNYSLLAQEHARHGNLLDFIKKNSLSVPERRLVFWQVGQALQHLHSNSIVHRDIKLDNILIIDHEQGVTAKLADFGFATTLRLDSPLLNSFKGTRRGYMAPQIHACREDTSKHFDGKAADIFAFGVVLFAIVLGRLPFEFGLATDKLYGLLAEGKSKEFWESHAAALNKLSTEKNALTQEFQHLFENLVTIQPQKRLTIEEVISHPWTAALRERPQV